MHDVNPMTIFRHGTSHHLFTYFYTKLLQGEYNFCWTAFVLSTYSFLWHEPWHGSETLSACKQVGNSFCSFPHLAVSDLFQLADRDSSIFDSLFFFWQDLPTFSLWQAVPNWRVLGVLASSALITHYSNVWVMDRDHFLPTAALHVAVGFSCLAILVATVYKYERSFLRGLAEVLGSRS